VLYSIGVGNFLGLKRVAYFARISTKLPENFYATSFLPANFLYLVRYIFLYHIALDLKTEDFVPNPNEK